MYMEPGRGKISLDNNLFYFLWNTIADGFFAIYMDGSKNISGCDSTVVTNVTLVCNNSASWDFSNPDITRHVKTYSVDGCKVGGPV